ASGSRPGWWATASGGRTRPTLVDLPVVLATGGRGSRWKRPACPGRTRYPRRPTGSRRRACGSGFVTVARRHSAGGVERVRGERTPSRAPLVAGGNRGRVRPVARGHSGRGAGHVRCGRRPSAAATAAGRDQGSVDAPVPAVAQRGRRHRALPDRDGGLPSGGSSGDAGGPGTRPAGVPVAGGQGSHRGLRGDRGVSAAGVAVAVDSGVGGAPPVTAVRRFRRSGGIRGH